MINSWEVQETNEMIEKENLDVRTITLGISLLDCIDSDLDRLNQNIYNKITTVAKDLVATGEKIEKSYSIPIVNKRISVTPIALVGGSACKTPEDFATIAATMDRAAKTVGVNLIGGYSALNPADTLPVQPLLSASIPDGKTSDTAQDTALFRFFYSYLYTLLQNCYILPHLAFPVSVKRYC